MDSAMIILGWMAPGLYVARLDGTAKRLLVQLDDRYVADPLFSPEESGWHSACPTRTYRRPPLFRR